MEILCGFGLLWVGSVGFGTLGGRFVGTSAMGVRVGPHPFVLVVGAWCPRGVWVGGFGVGVVQWVGFPGPDLQILIYLCMASLRSEQSCLACSIHMITGRCSMRYV